MKARKNQVFWIGNRKNKTVEVLGPSFRFWEEVQGCAQCGFRMSDGTSADCIGRCRNMAEFQRRLAIGNTTLLTPA